MDALRKLAERAPYSGLLRALADGSGRSCKAAASFSVAISRSSAGPAAARRAFSRSCASVSRRPAAAERGHGGLLGLAGLDRLGVLAHRLFDFPGG